MPRFPLPSVLHVIVATIACQYAGPLSNDPGKCYVCPVPNLWVVGSMRAAIIADDLTGAADTGVQLARAGYRTAVAFRGASVPPSKDLDAVALDTDSREIGRASCRERV